MVFPRRKEMASAVTVIRETGEGEKLWFAGGGLFTMKATSEETGGEFVLFEDREVLGKPTPLHLHPGDDETLYILEGEIRVYIDGEERTVGQGGSFYAPRGVPHAFLVTSETAHLLCLVVPGTGWAQVQYQELCEPANEDSVPGSHPADFAKLMEVAKHTDTIEILGPPPFASLKEEATPTPA
jgi:quercetin dioxygenase-like cupin family protein